MEDFMLPKIGLGTWTMGGKKEADYSNDEKCIEAIALALDIGYTHIDTAEVYGAGHSEELIAQAIQGQDRASLIIASKVKPQHLAYDDVLTAAEGSLKRLGLPYLDLYYIHAPSSDNVPIAETMRAFDRLVEEGMIKHIGVSNFTKTQLQEAQAITHNTIVANQIEYNLYTREIGKHSVHMESETLPYCQEQAVYIVAERPLERGLLLKKTSVMDEMAQKYNASYAQIALNWLVSQKDVIAIPKATSRAHLQENFDATSWTMDVEDIERLRKEYPDQQ
jgi:diketogulonate reductase-like aldo/keto reductase